MPATEGRIPAMIGRDTMTDDNPRFPSLADAADQPPAPASAFHWHATVSGPMLSCDALGGIAQHAFTSRQLALPASAVPDAARSAWSAVATAIGADPARVWRVRQVHGREVRVVRSIDDPRAAAAAIPDGDAVVTNAPGGAVGVMVADCVPVLLADRQGRAVGAVHAGWRGTCAGIATASIEALRREFGVPADQLVAAIGPSIGREHYEVGEVVRAAFVAAGHAEAEIARWFSADAPGAPCRLDLWAANRDQLVAAGVAPEAIHVAGLSTWAHAHWLESFRRDGAAAGRMIAMIRMPDGI
jgi:polyphenol oxidase